MKSSEVQKSPKKARLKVRSHPLEDSLDEFLDLIREEKRLQPATLRQYECEIRQLFALLPRPQALPDLRRYLAQKKACDSRKKTDHLEGISKNVPAALERGFRSNPIS